MKTIVTFKYEESETSEGTFDITQRLLKVSHELLLQNMAM